MTTQEKTDKVYRAFIEFAESVDGPEAAKMSALQETSAKKLISTLIEVLSDLGNCAPPNASARNQCRK